MRFPHDTSAVATHWHLRARLMVSNVLSSAPFHSTMSKPESVSWPTHIRKISTRFFVRSFHRYKHLHPAGKVRRGYFYSSQIRSQDTDSLVTGGGLGLSTRQRCHCVSLHITWSEAACTGPVRPVPKVGKSPLWLVNAGFSYGCAPSTCLSNSERKHSDDIN